MIVTLSLLLMNNTNNKTNKTFLFIISYAHKIHVTAKKIDHLPIIRYKPPPVLR
jgi:hypothetical protein